MPHYASSYLPPSPQSTPRNSSSSSAGARFNANSNLMNYSIPKEEDRPPPVVTSRSDSKSKREIQQGDSSTRTRQLEAQIESLTLQNVKLQRTNRLLKVDTDNLIKQKTRPLEKTIQELTLANVQLQRATRLLQQDLEEKGALLEMQRRKAIQQTQAVGPEYEFLVQMVNLLQRQISGHPACDETCCYTLAPINQSNMVMTLASENENDMEAQHICRPTIHSAVSNSSYTVDLEHKIAHLEQMIEEFEREKEQLLRQQGYKDNDIETLKKELRIKDDIVTRLEQDFFGLEAQLASLQKELHGRQTPPPASPSDEPIRDPKRQSQLLMASKRRSLAIKDTDALERMLRGDLHVRSEPEEEDEDEDEEDEEDDDDAESDGDTNITTPPRSASPPSSTSPRVRKKDIAEKRRVLSFVSCGVLPCAYPTSAPDWAQCPVGYDKDPFALFTVMTLFLGMAAQLGITDDWTLPITLAVLVSGFLWSGAAKGVQLKLKIK